MCTCTQSTLPATVAAPIHGAVFKVDDMSCAHCVGTISKALEKGMPGVRFSIDLDSHEVTVAGDAAVAEAIIRDAGYEPMLLVH